MGSNRDALGAKVTVEFGKVTSKRQLFPAKGYLSSVEHPLTFGLGSAGKADRVTIVWPSGAKTERTDLVAGQTYRIVEPRRPRLQRKSTGPRF